MKHSKMTNASIWSPSCARVENYLIRLLTKDTLLKKKPEVFSSK